MSVLVYLIRGVKESRVGELYSWNTFLETDI